MEEERSNHLTFITTIFVYTVVSAWHTHALHPWHHRESSHIKARHKAYIPNTNSTETNKMGANATVYEKPPTFDDGPEYFADYSNFKGATTDKTVVQEIRYSMKG